MSSNTTETAYDDITAAQLRAIFEASDYVADDDIVTTVQLSLHLGKPLLIEGEPGAGKTELAKVLAEGFDTDLVRLQCYEGLAAEQTLYEWNYTKQLLAVQADERGATVDDSVFDEEYLLERPLLQALSSDGETPPVLLIDEIDRADEEFEALLLEVLSDFQISIPELGTVRAERPPIVVITSNRTRGLSDALKRRCLYLHIEPPSFEKELAIVDEKVPELESAIVTEICAMTQRLREESFLKQPGIAETLDWAQGIAAIRGADEGADPLTVEELEATLSCLLKEVEDYQRVDDDLLTELRENAREARDRGRS